MVAIRVGIAEVGASHEFLSRIQTVSIKIGECVLRVGWIKTVLDLIGVRQTVPVSVPPCRDGENHGCEEIKMKGVNCLGAVGQSGDSADGVYCHGRPLLIEQ
ncbi:MAG TPA: hypothetical protein VH394_00030 [Thermoanaerobaculia bacterium]|nr:hypothetical protein [Thermoanaerobaculia bacterium]